MSLVEPKLDAFVHPIEILAFLSAHQNFDLFYNPGVYCRIHFQQVLVYFLELSRGDLNSGASSVYVSSLGPNFRLNAFFIIRNVQKLDCPAVLANVIIPV